MTRVAKHVLRRRAETRARIAMGIKGGCILAGALALYVVAVAALSGSAPFDELGTTLWQTLVGYGLAGVVGGALAGWAASVTRTRWGHTLAGAGIGVIAYLLIGLAAFGARWDVLVAAPLPGLLIGALCGYTLSRVMRS